MAVADRSIEVSGRRVVLSSPDKVFFPGSGHTKGDLADYYLAVGPALLRTIAGRPTLFERYPDGVKGKSFFQKRVPRGAPDWIETTTVSTVNGTTSEAIVIADLAHVVWAVQMGCLGFHPWPFLATDPDHADELRMDLDPSPGVDFAMVREAASVLRDLFDELGITSFPKTTGSRGIHVYVRLEPRWDSYDVRHAAVAVARELERRRPDLLTAAWWKEERGARVFVDYNQNAPHKTVFGAWCVRPRVGGQVSTPFPWDDLTSVDPEDLTLATVPDHLAERGDPWETMGDHPQNLEPLLELHRLDREDRGLLDAPWPPVYPKMPDEPPRVAPSRAAGQEGRAAGDGDAGS